MILNTILSFALASPLAALPAAPQDDTLAEQIDQYKEILDGREQESEAIALIDAFVQVYLGNRERLVEIKDMLEIEEGDPGALKKERKEIDKRQEELADLVWLAFKERKRETEAHRQLWHAAVYAFGQMGPEGAAYLRELWKKERKKRFKDSVDFQALWVQQLGATRDWSQGEFLVDQLDYHEDLVIAKAAEALTFYREAPGEVRKLATEKLVGFLNSYYNAQTNPEDTTSRRRYRQVRGPMLKALEELTGQAFRDPLDWRKWYNNTGKKDRELWKDD